MTQLSETATALCVLLVFLAPLAAAGLSLINAGLGRSRSAAHSMLSSLAMSWPSRPWCTSSAGSPGKDSRPARARGRVAGKSWNWIAAEPFFLRGLPLDGSPASLVALLQMFSVGLAALIPLGAGTDRWRLGAGCASTALLAGWTYPLFAHWVWGGGWLAQLGVNCGLGRGFVDAGGAGSHSSGGWPDRLVHCLDSGTPAGQVRLEGVPAAIPGHNAVLVLFACFLALAGMVWPELRRRHAVRRRRTPDALALVAVNTTLAAAMAALAAAAITRFRFGRPDASLCANGWVGGLVASSAACAFMTPAAAVLTVWLPARWSCSRWSGSDMRLGVDDPAGAISVHAVGGIWGVLALGIFARFPRWRDSGQFVAQLAGVATLLGFVLPLTYCSELALEPVLPATRGGRGRAARHGPV